MTTIKNRRGTKAEWSAANPVLAAGEEGAELDTGKTKMGDGQTAWNSLEYFIPESAVTAKINAAIDADSNPSPAAVYQSAKA